MHRQREDASDNLENITNNIIEINQKINDLIVYQTEEFKQSLNTKSLYGLTDLVYNQFLGTNVKMEVSYISNLCNYACKNNWNECICMLVSNGIIDNVDLCSFCQNTTATHLPQDFNPNLYYERNLSGTVYNDEELSNLMAQNCILKTKERDCLKIKFEEFKNDKDLDSIIKYIELIYINQLTMGLFVYACKNNWDECMQYLIYNGLVRDYNTCVCGLLYAMHKCIDNIIDSDNE